VLVVGLFRRPNVLDQTEMSDIKTSLKPSAPILSKRYTKSPRYVYVSHHIHRTVLPTASVDIQHLSIPAALFTDAVDPECVPLRIGRSSFADFQTGPSTSRQVGGRTSIQRVPSISTEPPS